ncbi:MAG: AMP-binding protein [Victivallales bacterium]|nr:AMP-binding protein [Victivallales bacterium]
MSYKSFRGLSFKGAGEIRDAQTAMLRTHLSHVLSDSRFYRDALKGVKPDSIGMSDLVALPMTSKDDIEARGKEFQACPDSDIVDMVHTSGTTGAPVYFGYSESDLARLQYNETEALSAAGISKSDTVLLTCTIDRCFIAGLAYYLGCRGIGATSVRSGISTLESHLRLIRDLRPSALIGVPSFLLSLAKFAKSSGMTPENAGVKRLVCIGEPLWSAEFPSGGGHELHPTPVSSMLQKMWAAKCYSTYASSETASAFCECEVRNGGHLIPELCIVEIVDENGTVLGPGEPGEVVLTPLHVMAMPLVRYRTGDVSFLMDAPCPCGRNSLRLGPIIGRKNQMIKCQGTKFYPNAVFNTLDSLEFVRLYQIQIMRDALSDSVKVAVALSNPDRLQEVAQALRGALRVRIEVEACDLDDLNARVSPAGSRKPVKLIERLQKANFKTPHEPRYKVGSQ